MFLLLNKDESENNSQDTSVYNEITSWQKYFNTTVVFLKIVETQQKCPYVVSFRRISKDSVIYIKVLSQCVVSVLKRWFQTSLLKRIVRSAFMSTKEWKTETISSFSIWYGWMRAIWSVTSNQKKLTFLGNLIGS